MLHWAALLLLAAVLAVSAALLRNRWRLWRQVDKLPGYTALPLLGTTYRTLLTKREDLLREVDKAHKKFSPIFRNWLGSIPIIQISKPEHIEKILSSTEILDKSVTYNFLYAWLGEGLLTSTGTKWHSHRKLITPAFHFRILDEFIDVFAEKSEILVQNLKTKADGCAFDIYPYITRCALDIICETAMGAPVYAQQEVESPYVTAVYTIGELFIRRIHSPWLHSDFIYRRTSTGKEYYKQLNVLHSFTRKVINERKQLRMANGHRSKPKEYDEVGQKKRVAFLDLLLDASAEGQLLNDREIQEEVDTFMFEGHDTTSVAIAYALMLLGLHPNVQEKVYAEIQTVFESVSNRTPTINDLNNLKYLEMVIKESLRLFPSVPSFSRCVTKDVEVGGYNIPRGSMITMNVRHTHRDPDHWPQPDRFDPDRFLPERVRGRHPYAFVPFSAGPRNCIGQKFAVLEEKTVLSYILRHFRVVTVGDPEALKLVGEFVLRPLNGLSLRLSPR